MDSNNNPEQYQQSEPIAGIQLHENEYDSTIQLVQEPNDSSDERNQNETDPGYEEIKQEKTDTTIQPAVGSNRFIKIRERESTDDSEVEPIEIELEQDRSLLLSSLASLFPAATGLTFRHPETNSLRGVKLVDGKFAEPAEGWESVPEYVCVLSKNTGKRKAQDEGVAKRLKTDGSSETNDEGIELIVLGLQWRTSEDTMKEYFEQFGEVLEVQVKKDRKSGKSKGFGFVRFSDPDVEEKLTSKRHCIDGRWCDVKVPLTKAEAESTKAAQLSRKIFVGRLPNDITEDDLREHFSTYGTLTDVYIPKPFRNFAFVTFGTSVMAKSIYGVEHNIKGATVQISEAIPRDSYGGQNNNHYNNNSNNNSSNSKGFNNNINNSTNNNNTYRQNQYKSHQQPYSPQQTTYPGNYNNYNNYNHTMTNPGYNNNYSSSYNQPYPPNSTTHHYRMHQAPQAPHHQHNPPQAMPSFHGHNPGFARGNSYQVWKQ